MFSQTWLAFCSDPCGSCSSSLVCWENPAPSSYTSDLFWLVLLKHGQNQTFDRILRTNQIWLLSQEGIQSSLDGIRIQSASILFKIIGSACGNTWTVREAVFQPSRAIQLGKTRSLSPCPKMFELHYEFSFSLSCTNFMVPQGAASCLALLLCKCLLLAIRLRVNSSKGHGFTVRIPSAALH